MTKREYLRNLQDALQALPYEDRNEALDFYENYFDEAGRENEQKIIEELGDVKVLAEKIQNNEALLPQAVKSTSQNERKKSAEKTVEKSDKSNLFSDNKWLIIIILVVTCPIWFSAVVSIIGTLFGVVCGVFGLAVGLIAASIGMGIGAVAILILGFFNLSMFPGGFLIPLGIALLLSGLTIFFWMLGIAMFTIFIPWCWKGIKTVWNKIKDSLKSTKDAQ